MPPATDLDALRDPGTWAASFQRAPGALSQANSSGGALG